MEMGLEPEDAIDALGRFHCGFGRMEDFALGKKGAKMMLVKNPAGANQVLNFLKAMTEPMELALCLNDRDADGTDVSWIWDVDFESLAEIKDRLSAVYVSGVRAADLRVRLKIAGVPGEILFVEKDYERLAEKLADAEERVYIIPTYTAMLDFRACLVKRLGGSDFWEG